MVEEVFTDRSKLRQAERSRWLRVVLLFAVVVLAMSRSSAQTTTTTVTRTVRSPDAWTVIEYPVEKEVVTKLTPGKQLPEAEGWATVRRTDDGTRININVALGGRKTEILEKKGVRYRGWKTSNNDFKTCVDETITIGDGVVTKTNDTCKGTRVVQVDPALSQPLTAYAVDDRGTFTPLGPVLIKDGTGTMSATIPLAKFMLVLSPEILTSIDDNMRFTFQSAVPAGFAVIPMRLAEGERVAAVGAIVTSNPYDVPIFIIAGLRQGDDTKLKVNFSGALSGPTADAVLTPREDGPTKINIRVNGLKEPPAGQAFVLWALSPGYKFANLGKIVNTPGRNEAEIKAEIAWPAFGLLITMEDAANASGEKPVGPTIATIEK